MIQQSYGKLRACDLAYDISDARQERCYLVKDLIDAIYLCEKSSMAGIQYKLVFFLREYHAWVCLPYSGS